MFYNPQQPSFSPVRKTGPKTALILVALSILTFGVPSVAIAGIESDPNLEKLEMKFFQHDFAKEDTADKRLARLEKMIFGEAKTGDQVARLKNLVAAVPNLNNTADQSPDAIGSSSSASSSNDQQPVASTPSRGRGASRSSAPADTDNELAQREQSISGSSQYPQVSAMEKKVLGRDYSNDAIVKRLERLETKVYGKPSESDDLSERVDRLKARTGIDLAATPPPGTDWSDDDDEQSPRGGGDLTYVPADTTPFTNRRTPATNLGGSVPSDFADRSSSYGGGSGGGGSSLGSSSGGGYSRGGSYGYNPPRKIASATTPRTAPTGMPEPAPDVVREPSAVPPAALGLNQRVGLLENNVFNKTFPNDTLPQRISRLENTVFAGKRTPADMSLPERVNRIADALGPGSDTRRAAASRSLDALAEDPQMPRPAPQRRSLSKIIGAMGNMLGGGTGGYNMGSNLVTDPQTGMLVDMYSGNVIDPTTGAVVGNRGISPGSTYSGGGMGSYSGFGNGLSPLGSGYGGIRSGMGFGLGGGGMRMGGMGFGTGMGLGMPGMGMGVGGFGW